MKRNTVEYDIAGAATERDALELYEFTKRLHVDVIDWLRRNHPKLRALPEPKRCLVNTIQKEKKRSSLMYLRPDPLLPHHDLV